MDAVSINKLASLIRSQRTAALGTLRDSAPLVSMVLFSVLPDFSAFFIHTSRLAHHTQDILQDPRISLMIAEIDPGAGDPQLLARISIRGTALEFHPSEDGYAEAKSLYLQKHPQTAMNFGMGDFSLYRIQPQSARYVAGFGKIFNLVVEDLIQVAGSHRSS